MGYAWRWMTSALATPALSYLKRYPFDTLKIDQSFIRDLCQDGEDDSLVKTIILMMAKNLNLRAVAEGVETQQQLDFLCANRCDNSRDSCARRRCPPTISNACCARSQIDSELLHRHAEAKGLRCTDQARRSRAWSSTYWCCWRDFATFRGFHDPFSRAASNSCSIRMRPSPWPWEIVADHQCRFARVGIGIGDKARLRRR